MNWYRRCDLLSFHYLCAIRDSGIKQFSNDSSVVICFHFIIFVLSGTASQPPAISPLRLWFAFISLSLCYQGQPTNNRRPTTSSCDLLSFHYLCAIRDSFHLWFQIQGLVVICFHFIIFVLSGTACLLEKPDLSVLWFAFISLSLCYQGQQPACFLRNWCRCDLLSFHYLCAIRDSTILFRS